jgi:hypothetical protein
MKKIKKQNPKIVGSKPRKIKWHRSKDGHGMPYASCEVKISDACDFYVLAEVMHHQGNQYSFYIDAPCNVTPEIKVFGFEQAIERAENRILRQIRKAHEQLARWI